MADVLFTEADCCSVLRSLSRGNKQEDGDGVMRYPVASHEPHQPRTPCRGDQAAHQSVDVSLGSLRLRLEVDAKIECLSEVPSELEKGMACQMVGGKSRFELAGLVLLPDEEAEGTVYMIQRSSEIADLLHELIERGVISVKMSVADAKAEPEGCIAVTLAVDVHQSFDADDPQLCPPSLKRLQPRVIMLYQELFAPEHMNTSERWRLADMFDEASKARVLEEQEQVALQQQQRQHELESSKRRMLSAPSLAPHYARCMLTSLSDEVLSLIISWLEARDTTRLGETCQLLSRLTALTVPGLKAKLYKHQQRCLAWMLHREKGGSQHGHMLLHPAVVHYVTKGGKNLYVNTITGAVAFSLEGARRMRDVRGGFFCDAPGLGKTVTALALILKSRGMLPSTPALAHPQQDGARFEFRSPHSRRREVNTYGLLPTPATLVIVPGPLVEHWREQIQRHVAPWAFRRGVFYATSPSSRSGAIKYNALPRAEVLASCYDVVVLTKESLRSEWLRGKPRCALEERLPARYREHFDVADERDDRLSALLKVRWLRIIVDEGHSLGNLNITNEDRMTTTLEAERRWVMTGTPTRLSQESEATDLRSLRSLLAFLRHEAYGGRDGEEAWARLITRCPEAAVSGARLLEMLRKLMIRHTKEEIKEIPKPIWRVRLLTMSALEARTYNTLVSLVQANLLTTGMEGGTHQPGPCHPDSLLNSKNRAHAMTVMENVRMACCGGGKQIISINQASVDETLQLSEKFGGCPEDVAKVAAWVRRCRSGRDSQCECCGAWLQLLLITPCMCLTCVGCMVGRNNTCSVCNTTFSTDEFQLLQPGWSVGWDDDIRDVMLDLPPVAPAPLDGGSGSRSNSSSPVPALQRPNSAAAAPSSPLGSASTSARPASPDKVDDDDGSWDVVSKARHVADVMRAYQEAHQEGEKGALRPLKAIVFSQFKAYREGLYAALLSQGFGVGRFYHKHRNRDLIRFQHDDNCHALLIGKEGSHGLDLSFATHIFIMESIWDLALTSQLVSRAWRMGAKGPVIVEKLIMEGTVEEEMNELALELVTVTTGADSAYGASAPTHSSSSSSFKSGRTGGSASERQDQVKLRYLMQRLRLVQCPVAGPLRSRLGSKLSSSSSSSSWSLADPVRREDLDAILEVNRSEETSTEAAVAKKVRWCEGI